MQGSAFFCKRKKGSRVLLCSLQKNETFSAFFYVLCKRILHSCIVILGFISRQKLKKRTEKHFAFFKRMEKNGTFRMEKNAVPNPGISSFYFRGHTVSIHLSYEAYVIRIVVPTFTTSVYKLVPEVDLTKYLTSPLVVLLTIKMAGQSETNRIILMCCIYKVQG